MCGIVGIEADNNNKDVGRDILTMLNAIKHRGPDGSGIFMDGKIVYNRLENLEPPEASFGMGHNLLSIVGRDVLQPIEKHGLILIANAEIYNFRELKNCLEENFKTDSDCEVIISVVKRFYNGSLVDAIERSLEYLDGDYAFAIYDGIDCAVVRDPLGIKPVYYGEDSLRGLSGFASERKALWRVGIKNVHTLPPDHVLLNGVPKKLETRKIYPGIEKACADETENMSGSEVWSGINAIKDTVEVDGISWINGANKSNNRKDVIKKHLMELLMSAVDKRIKGLSKVGVIFSGGVDSSIIAKLSDDLGVDTTLYTVGHESSSDVKYAIKTAESMNLPLKVKKLDVEDVKLYTELVLNAIEEFNIMKLGVGMPSYVASEMASTDGLKVVMSGQGADEIFAGYHRYMQFYKENGENARDYLEEDLRNLYHVNLQRDDAVTMANGVELRVPYLDKMLVNTAMKVPMKYKLRGGEDDLRKCILREIAGDIGVPGEIVRRPKKAAQYGSGIHKILVKKVLRDERYKTKLEALLENWK